MTLRHQSPETSPPSLLHAFMILCIREWLQKKLFHLNEASAIMTSIAQHDCAEYDRISVNNDIIPFCNGATTYERKNLLDLSLGR